jgi:hypothetical protein
MGVGGENIDGILWGLEDRMLRKAVEYIGAAELEGGRKMVLNFEVKTLYHSPGITDIRYRYDNIKMVKMEEERKG